MKLLDKFKNMFTEPQVGEDEEDNIIVEKIQQDVTHVSIASPTPKSNNENIEQDKIIERFKVEEEKPEIKPVFFDENDFNDLNFKSSAKKEEKFNLYEEKNKVNKEKVKPDEKKRSEPVEEEKKIFKPTPIISPVYGILDKNYHKEDIVSKQERQETPSVEPTIDTIRNKAYGTLEDELENTLFGSNSILFKNNFKDTNEKSESEIEPEEELTEVNDDVLSNLTDDIGKELDELLVKKEKYSDEEIKQTIKNDNNLSEEDLLGFIDSTLYKTGDEE